MTTQGFAYPCRVSCLFENKKALILLDQMQAVDKLRLLRKLGSVSQETQAAICNCLQEMFAL